MTECVTITEDFFLLVSKESFLNGSAALILQTKNLQAFFLDRSNAAITDAFSPFSHLLWLMPNGGINNNGFCWLRSRIKRCILDRQDAKARRVSKNLNLFAHKHTHTHPRMRHLRAFNYNFTLNGISFSIIRSLVYVTFRVAM